MYGLDEYHRCLYSWDAFLRHTVYVTNIQGSALYDVTLGDKELINQIFDQLVKEQSSKVKVVEKEKEISGRPPRRGYSREVEAIYDLSDHIVALRAEMGKWSGTATSRAMSKRPLFPAEAAQERMRLRAKKRRDDAVAKAQARWQRENDGSGA